jgi:hypothetical protein
MGTKIAGLVFAVVVLPLAGCGGGGGGGGGTTGVPPGSCAFQIPVHGVGPQTPDGTVTIELSGSNAAGMCNQPGVVGLAVGSPTATGTVPGGSPVCTGSVSPLLGQIQFQVWGSHQLALDVCSDMQS